MPTGNPVNAWAELGPRPQINNLAFAGMQAGEVSSGRVTSLATGQFDGQTVLYAGAAGGGVWRSSALNSLPLTWTARTDTSPAFNSGTG